MGAVGPKMMRAPGGLPEAPMVELRRVELLTS